MNERIKLLISRQGLSASKFAEKIGVQASGISHIISGRNKPGYDFIVKVLENFPEVNPDWLLLGAGGMFRGGAPISSGAASESSIITDTPSLPGDDSAHISGTGKENRSLDLLTGGIVGKNAADDQGDMDRRNFAGNGDGIDPVRKNVANDEGGKGPVRRNLASESQGSADGYLYASVGGIGHSEADYGASRASAFPAAENRLSSAQEQDRNIAGHNYPQGNNQKNNFAEVKVAPAHSNNYNEDTGVTEHGNNIIENKTIPSRAEREIEKSTSAGKKIESIIILYSDKSFISYKPGE